jgi:hypothetical protein
MQTVRGMVILIAAFALLQLSCNKGGGPVAPDTSGNTLSGIVRDSDGNPLENVGVHYVFTTSSIRPLSKPGETCPSTTIGYSLTTPGHVLLRILRWYTREAVDTLINKDLNAGKYATGFDGGGLTNGIYLYQIVTDSATREGTFTLLNPDVNALVLTKPLATSDARGEFSIPYGVFGFSVVMHVTSSSGPTIIDSVCISPSIELVLYKEGYQVLARPVTIDTTQAMSVAITLARQ